MIIILHNLNVFCTFSTFAQKSLRDEAEISHEGFGKVMRTKSMRMMVVASIIRLKSCMIYVFLIFLFENLF